MKLSDRHITWIGLTLWIWVLVVCLVPNVGLSITEDLSIMQRIANVLLPLGIYWVLMTLCRKPGISTFIMLPFMVIAAFQIVLLDLYGRSPIAVDMLLNVVTTNSSEVGELLYALRMVLVWVLVLFVPPIVVAVWAETKNLTFNSATITRLRMGAVCALVVGVVSFGAAFTSKRPYDPLSDLFPVNVGYNAYLASQRTQQLLNYPQTSAKFCYHATSTHPDSIPETYVIIIGETSRAANWQLFGYSRPTTPRLMGKPHLVSFKRALSQSNTTHKSVPLMLSPLSAESYGDSLNLVKSVITAFKEAGFNTAFFSNQMHNHSYIDYFGEEADTCVFIKELPNVNPEKCYDQQLLPLLAEQLHKPYNKKLIVLHCYGSHFNYNDRYPRSYAKFLPDGPLNVSPDLRDMMVNAYDNTILYSSDMIAMVIEMLNDQHCVCACMYASDHGEDIFDDQHQLFLHASPIPTIHQLHVPCLVWLSDEYIKSYPVKEKRLMQNRDRFVATSDALFHTTVDLAGLNTPYLQKSHSLASRAYQPPKPVYVNDHNLPTPLKLQR